ncbi:MAG: DUF4386 domain-containing protein [Dehalococcoidia bacterium]|nr:DUF4386 domain-containing protein [Dehalococcoidia bacterium]MCA9825102.1 DUF4386 domain-containing protein [Dehalococcoidia bacterium]MCA9844716.1 DUF4386 domain-containing protein [Dehalococcoidia bacterium]MCA9852962.1 DUF4386 domain-containing protein [Dehalococcoidia bacterium]
MLNVTTTAMQERAARFAGVGYLAIIICGILAEFLIRSTLIEAGDPAETARKIAESESLFRLSIVGDVVMLTFDALVAVALFVVFRTFSPAVAFVSSAFRLLHTAIYGAMLITLFFAWELTTGADYLQGLGVEQSQALGLLFIEAHAYGYALALMFFAIHVVFLGYLVIRSGYMPRVLGYMLIAAAIGYFADGLARTLMTNYAEHEDTFGIVVFGPAFIAELAFTGWLLFKGIRVGSSDRRVSASRQEAGLQPGG